MISAKNLVLGDVQVRQKIRRMAFEVYEKNFSQKSIFLAGIDGQGYSFAKVLGKEIAGISPLKVVLIKVTMNKETPQLGEISVDCDLETLKKKTIVLIDDVLNTGRTLAYAMKPFLSIEVQKIEVAVLVNRSHPGFPIQPTYTGYELSTSLTEHVTVVLGEKSAVYLH